VIRSILVCSDDFLWRLLASAGPSHFNALHVVEQPRARARIAQQGGAVLAGHLEREGVYHRAFRTGHEPVLVAVDRPRQARVVAAIRRAAPEAAIVLFGDAMDALAERVLDPALERALTRGRVERIRAHFARAERVLILMQDDPDPDAIASALAFKALLGRNRTAATMGTFGTITRAENRAMTRVLEIDVEAIKPRALDDYDMIAIVDAQPSFFEERIERVDFVVDHHPEETPVRATLKDIRPSYGATATILTEYLRAADVKLPQRLATALLYGIKADTQHLERGATRADLDAFVYVHGQANRSALRRIERPELTDDALAMLARGIMNRQIVGGVVFAHLGPVAYPELIAQFADFFLQVEGVEWSVVSGTVHGEVHVSVRNVGYVRAAGEVVRAAFGDLGGAGGHRSMAKAVIRLRDWRARHGAATSRALAQGIVGRFTRALRS
jgi:nanoRNase/pAp phosphatase (c-di-AMP/oligoRNAs hydrolase)